MESSRPATSFRFSVGNPFSFKVGQVFTGVGVGCGIGVGVGTPLNLGAIPVLQQVMSAARGATDAFSGVGRHINGSFRRLGVKRIEAGVGCGVGIGHGFGVGLAIKPGVLDSIQSFIAQGIKNIIGNIGSVPGGPGNITSYFQRDITKSVETQGTNFTPIGTEVTGIASHDRVRDQNSNVESRGEHFSQRISSEALLGRRSEKVINSFLQNPLLENKEELELDEVARKLRSENNVLQMLLKHQQIIEELIEENDKFRRALVEDLKVPASKILDGRHTGSKLNDPCSDCFECRRKRRTR